MGTARMRAGSLLSGHISAFFLPLMNDIYIYFHFQGFRWLCAAPQRLRSPPAPPAVLPFGLLGTSAPLGALSHPYPATAPGAGGRNAGGRGTAQQAAPGWTRQGCSALGKRPAGMPGGLGKRLSGFLKAQGGHLYAPSEDRELKIQPRHESKNPPGPPLVCLLRGCVRTASPPPPRRSPPEKVLLLRASS